MSIWSADDITQAEHYTKQTLVKQWLILMLYKNIKTLSMQVLNQVIKYTLLPKYRTVGYVMNKLHAKYIKQHLASVFQGNKISDQGFGRNCLLKYMFIIIQTSNF